MSMWLIYFILKLDVVSGILIGIPFAFFLLIFFAFSIIVIDDEGFNEDTKKIWNRTKKWILFASILLLTGIFMPNTKETAMIYVLPKIINNKQIQKMPNKLVTLANAWMDEELKSIKQEK